MGNADMLDDLADWVTDQRDRLTLGGKRQASYAALARDILLKTGHEVTNESLRSWELKSLKTNPSPAKLQVILDYASATGQERPDWIPAAASTLTLLQIIGWLDTAPLSKVALMVAHGIGLLERSNHGKFVSPQIAEMAVQMPDQRLCELINASDQSLEEIAELANISLPRLQQIMQGRANAQLGEIALLASVLLPNGDVDEMISQRS